MTHEEALKLYKQKKLIGVRNKFDLLVSAILLYYRLTLLSESTQYHYLLQKSSFFFLSCGAIVDIQMSGYTCTFGYDKADEESFDFSSALLIATFIYSLCKSIRGRCAR